MTTDTTQTAPRSLPASADVVGGGVLALLGLLHLFGLGLGGVVGFLALLVGWPLIAGVVAGRLSVDATDRSVNGAVAGVFGSLTVTLLVLLTGLVGAWPAFITSNIGVTLWSVTLAVLAMLTISWTVFGYAGGFLADTLA
ncbi:hypothetical protein [Halobellus clavatus]|jgi:hypothetical protein|uniref:DUF5518 domain-containing protein n=1 Tax=Halobellus clavatus TaxID=660517 RepID=A0A1H3G027_9EURY|nr:hypothetical protein [Halobellus clavatus]SDX95988.1 hypothetical protein SAMN04487946_104241 [Halobellus clavatus]